MDRFDRIEMRRRQLVEQELPDRVSRLAAYDDLVPLVADRERANIAREMRTVAGNSGYALNRILTVEQVMAVADEIDPN